jgi:hypothetical protein
MSLSTPQSAFLEIAEGLGVAARKKIKIRDVTPG